jgi:hypothetical protein
MMASIVNAVLNYQRMATLIPSGLFPKLNRQVLLFTSHSCFIKLTFFPSESVTTIFLGAAGNNIRMTLVVLSGLLVTKV